MKKLESSVIGHGDVEIGEYRTVIFLLSFKCQRGRRVEHPFPAYHNSLSPAAWNDRDKRGGWERAIFDRVNAES